MKIKREYLAVLDGGMYKKSGERKSVKKVETKKVVVSPISMDDLPPALLLEILSRLADSTDVARCRLSSRALNAIAREIRSVNLQCSYQRYVNSRSPLTRSSVTPFKSIFQKLIDQSPIVERVSIGVGKPLGSVTYDDVEDEEDDLFLCEPVFVKTWLPRVSKDLKSVSISDFWVQSCWRRSDVLSLLSSYCN